MYCSVSLQDPVNHTKSNILASLGLQTSSILCLAHPGLGWAYTRHLGTPSRSPTWVVGTQILEPSSADL